MLTGQSIGAYDISGGASWFRAGQIPLPAPTTSCYLWTMGPVGWRPYGKSRGVIVTRVPPVERGRPFAVVVVKGRAVLRREPLRLLESRDGGCGRHRRSMPRDGVI